MSVCQSDPQSLSPNGTCLYTILKHVYEMENMTPYVQFNLYVILRVRGGTQNQILTGTISQKRGVI